MKPFTRHNARYVGAVVAMLAFAGLVSACSTTTDSNGNTVTVTMTPAQLAAQAKVVEMAFETSVSSYAASAPGAIDADTMAKITTAETAAKALIGSISTADVSSAAADALSIANSLATVANAIPGLPIEARAGIVAFQILVATLEPVIAPTPVVAALGAAAHAAVPTTIGIMPAGTKLHVLLIPNS